MALTHCHPSQGKLISLRIYVSVEGRLIPAGVGSLAQQRCLLPGMEHPPCLPQGLGQPRGFWQRQSQCQLEWLQSCLGGRGKPRCLSLSFSPFPFRAVSSVEQGLVGVVQTPAHCNNLCLPGIPRVATHFFQIFYQFIRILHLFRGELTKHLGCPLS